MPQQQQASHTESRKDRKRTGVRFGRSIFRKQLRMAGWETKISHILTFIVIMRSPLKTSFVEHTHEQMKHNQLNYNFLLHILPQLLRILCQDEEAESKEQISLQLMFEDANSACQVLSDGVFLFGSRCWVSQYRHRKQRNCLQSSCTTQPQTTPLSYPLYHMWISWLR